LGDFFCVRFGALFARLVRCRFVASIPASAFQQLLADAVFIKKGPDHAGKSRRQPDDDLLPDQLHASPTCPRTRRIFTRNSGARNRLKKQGPLHHPRTAWEGTGQYGRHLSPRGASTTPVWWGEGEIKFYMDGEQGLPHDLAAPARRIILRLVPILTSKDADGKIPLQPSFPPPTTGPGARSSGPDGHLRFANTLSACIAWPHHRPDPVPEGFWKVTISGARLAIRRALPAITGRHRLRRVLVIRREPHNKKISRSARFAMMIWSCTDSSGPFPFAI